MRPRGAYDRSIRALSLVYVVIGVVILGLTVSRGGGPLSVGMLIGVAFIGIGIGRYLIQRKIADEGESGR